MKRQDGETAFGLMIYDTFDLMCMIFAHFCCYRNRHSIKSPCLGDGVLSGEV